MSTTDDTRERSVRCEECEGAGWNWKKVADDGLTPDDPVEEYPCEVCGGTGRIGVEVPS